MERYFVKQFKPHDFAVDVPASKSIFNRALLLAALGTGDVQLACGAYDADDTTALLDCLTRLGTRIERTNAGLLVRGCGGNFPVRRAELNVRSAGTAARFLVTALAFTGGEYLFTASEQMKKRPMDVLSVLSKAGVLFEFLERPGHFPFRMHSAGIRADELSVDTDLSTQYASGILLSAACLRPLTLHLTGSRTQGSYIEMTLELLRAFGAAVQRSGDSIVVRPAPGPMPARFEVESDLSAACYFYAMALLFGIRVLVRHIRFETLQGDVRFLQLLQQKGVRFCDTQEGLLADGSGISSFTGFDVCMRDYSDQALTLAALAPFATSPTRITGIGHTRRQECDRIHAIAANLQALGVPASEETDGVVIHPAAVHRGTVCTFGDHRVAMAFTLTGLKAGGIEIDDPRCCAKTFAGYFDAIDAITQT